MTRRRGLGIPFLHLWTPARSALFRTRGTRWARAAARRLEWALPSFSPLMAMMSASAEPRRRISSASPFARVDMAVESPSGCRTAAWALRCAMRIFCSSFTSSRCFLAGAFSASSVLRVSCASRSASWVFFCSSASLRVMRVSMRACGGIMSPISVSTLCTSYSRIAFEMRSRASRCRSLRAERKSSTV